MARGGTWSFWRGLALTSIGRVVKSDTLIRHIHVKEKLKSREQGVADIADFAEGRFATKQHHGYYSS